MHRPSTAHSTQAYSWTRPIGEGCQRCYSILKDLHHLCSCRATSPPQCPGHHYNSPVTGGPRSNYVYNYQQVRCSNIKNYYRQRMHMEPVLSIENISPAAYVWNVGGLPKLGWGRDSFNIIDLYELPNRHILTTIFVYTWLWSTGVCPTLISSAVVNQSATLRMNLIKRIWALCKTVDDDEEDCDIISIIWFIYYHIWDLTELTVDACAICDCLSFLTIAQTTLLT